MPNPLNSIAVLALTTSLAACGVPDAVAYGVKAVQHYNDGSGRPPAGAPAPVPAAAPAGAPAPVVIEAERSAPPPVTVPPRHGRITIEELPPVR